MGREARCEAEWDGRAAPATVLLESSELIVRGAVKARIARADMRRIAVTGDALTIETADGLLRLELGVKTATSWAEALKQPPPSLAAKLGLGPQAKAYVVGVVHDTALAEALTDARTRSLAQAAMIVGEATDATQLARLIDKAAETPGTPLWCIFPKGKGSTLPESAVRSAMRAAGYVDTKVAGVSDRMTGARFTPRR